MTVTTALAVVSDIRRSSEAGAEMAIVILSHVCKVLIVEGVKRSLFSATAAPSSKISLESAEFSIALYVSPKTELDRIPRSGP